jgi:hypothetical protein
LWKVTRSMTPKISSVMGPRSEIAAFMRGGFIFPWRAGTCVIRQGADSAGIWLPGGGSGGGWHVSKVMKIISALTLLDFHAQS